MTKTTQIAFKVNFFFVFDFEFIYSKLDREFERFDNLRIRCALKRLLDIFSPDPTQYG